MKNRLKKVPEGKIVKSIIRMRKKINGPIRLRTVFEAIEDAEGVYVNRSLIAAKLIKKGLVEHVDGMDVLIAKKR